MTGSGKIFNKRIKERINELKLKLEASTDVSGFKDAVTAFYKDFGVGKLGLHKAFRIQHREKEEVEIVPITNIAHVKSEFTNAKMSTESRQITACYMGMPEPENPPVSKPLQTSTMTEAYV